MAWVTLGASCGPWPCHARVSAPRLWQLLLLVVLAVRTSTARAAAAGPSDSSRDGGGPKCWSGLQTVPEYLSCLASVPLDPVKRDCTLEILATQLQSVYTYSGLVRNSLENDAKLAPGFNFSIYNMSLGGWIDELWSKLKVEKSAGLFAMRITQMFIKFNDAHTAVRFSPVYLTDMYPPVRVEPRVDNPSEGMKFVVVANRSWTHAGLVGKTISTVNGKPALEYFLDVADWKGAFKSRGARLNDFLLRQYLDGVPPPDDGAFKVAFEDGSSADLEWRADVRRHACGSARVRLCTRADVLNSRCKNMTEAMQRCFSHNPNFERLQAMMAKLGRKVLPCSENGTALELAPSQGASPPGLPAEAADSPGAAPAGPAEYEEPGPLEEKPGVLEEMRALAEQPGSAESAAPPVDVILALRGRCEVLRVRLQNGKAAAVLKLRSFSRPRMMLHCAKAAVRLAANESDGKLFVDVINNGGGDIEAGYLLNEYLFGKMAGTTYQTPEGSCEWYDLPKNKELDWFVRLSEQGLPDVQMASDPHQHVLAMAGRMDIGAAALATDRSFFGHWAKARALKNASACLRHLANSSNTSMLRGGVGGDSARQHILSQYKECLRRAQVEPFRARGWFARMGYVGPDILGYRWSNRYPKALSAPSWEYYTSTVKKVRGGEPRNFSSMTFFPAACDAYRAHYPKVYGQVAHDGIPPQTRVKHVTYVSDGLCGSTCSVASTRPYLDGLTTFVTLGGAPGQPLDITAFNGGNVATYQSSSSRSGLWAAAVGSMVDAEVFFPNDTLPSWPFLPIPLNIRGISFAQRAEYSRALGPQALPREWYLIPGSHHLDIWTSRSLSHYRGLSLPYKQKLYEIYSAVAALPPKPLLRTVL